MTDQLSTGSLADLKSLHGDVSKGLCHSESSKLSETAQMFILNLIVGAPGMHLHEICKEQRDFLGIDVEESTIWRFLHKIGITRQKMRINARLLRDDFMTEIKYQ